MSQEDTSKNLNPLPLSTRPSVDTNPEHTSLKYLLQSIFNPIFNSILKPIHKPILKSMLESSWINRIAILIITVCPFIHYFIVACNSNPIYIDLIRSIISLTVVFFIVRIVVSAYNSKELITNFFKNHPLQLFVSIIACGATTAFFLPLILNLFKFIGETDKLTTALLASTGGVIAVFTLIKTHQKNQTDEETLKHNKAVHAQQIEDRNEDIKRQISEREEQKKQFDKNFDLQSSKNKQDYTHQVHTDRRARYANAIEQLANDDKAAIRLGGVYALVGLVDEWLTDTTLDEKSRQKEGQVIINNLCAYIRSPFKLATKAKELEADTAPDTYDKEQFIADQAELHEEQNVRRTIFDEMSKRSSKLHIEKNYTVIIFTGAWSHFDYDFSRSQIFYPINHLTIEKPNFYASTFYGKGEFTGSTFIQRANFSKATFTHDTSFLVATFGGDATFSEATFIGEVNFCGTTYAGYTDFRGVTYNGTPDFEGVTFARAVNFSGAIFEQGANFRTTHFNKIANFIWTLFGKNPAINQAADFTDATFNQGATFYDATFKKNANFAKAKFLWDSKFGRADFSKVTFKGGGPGFLDARHREDISDQQLMKFYSASLDSDKKEIPQQTADFSEVTFEQEANFSNAIFGASTNSKQIIDFSNSKFKLGADFRSAIFKKDTYFVDSTFEKEEGSTQNVNFFSATFRRNTYFIHAVFKLDVDFRVQIFGQEVDFNSATFSGTTDFSEVIFRNYAGFSEVTFETSPPKFVFTTNSGVSYPAKFLAISEPYESHDFDVDAYQSNHTIDTGITIYKGIDYRVPKGTVVFEYPEDWDEAQQKPINYSSPAK